MVGRTLRRCSAMAPVSGNAITGGIGTSRIPPLNTYNYTRNHMHIFHDGRGPSDFLIISRYSACAPLLPDRVWRSRVDFVVQHSRVMGRVFSAIPVVFVELETDSYLVGVI